MLSSWARPGAFQPGLFPAVKHPARGSRSSPNRYRRAAAMTRTGPILPEQPPTQGDRPHGRRPLRWNATCPRKPTRALPTRPPSQGDPSASVSTPLERDKPRQADPHAPNRPPKQGDRPRGSDHPAKHDKPMQADLSARHTRNQPIRAALVRHPQRVPRETAARNQAKWAHQPTISETHAHPSSSQSFSYSAAAGIVLKPPRSITKPPRSTSRIPNKNSPDYEDPQERPIRAAAQSNQRNFPQVSRETALRIWRRTRSIRHDGPLAFASSSTGRRDTAPRGFT
ncbi:hypothetical protein LX88_001004 [Lentzea californiensis]|nr:hypothetical protein [Lentzea californiensis]